MLEVVVKYLPDGNRRRAKVLGRLRIKGDDRLVSLGHRVLVSRQETDGAIEQYTVLLPSHRRTRQLWAFIGEVCMPRTRVARSLMGVGHAQDPTHKV